MRCLIETFYSVLSYLSGILGVLLEEGLACVLHGMEMLGDLVKPPTENEWLRPRKTGPKLRTPTDQGNRSIIPSGLSDQSKHDPTHGQVPAGHVSDIRSGQLHKSHTGAHGKKKGRIRSWGGYEARGRPLSGESQETRSVTTSLRLNRFERPRQAECSPAIMRDSMTSAHSEELKFRTDFQECFVQFPLEKVFRRSWEPQASPIEIFAGKSSSKQLERLLYDDLESLFLAKDAKDDSNGNQTTDTKAEYATSEAPLPVHPDGSPIAELDAVSTSWSSIRAEEIAQANMQAIASPTLAEIPINTRKRKADRFVKRLFSLRPLSWATRASLRLQHTRKTLEPELSITGAPTSMHSNQSPPWKIEASEEGILLCHSGLPQPTVRLAGLASETEDTGTIESADFKWLQGGCDVDDHTVESPEHMANLGGCCVSIATQEQ